MLRNGFYNIAGAVLRMSLGLLSIPLLVRVIGLTEYGLWTLVFSTANLVSLVESGLAVSATVFISKDLASGEPEGISQSLTITVGTAVLLATLIASPFWFASDQLVRFVPTLTDAQVSVASHALWLSGFIIWMRLSQQVLVGFQQAFQKFGLLSTLSVIQSILTNLGMIVVAWLGGRTVALMQWTLIVTLLMLVVYVIVACRLIVPLKVRPLWDSTKSMAIAKYTMYTWLTMLGTTLFGQVDRLIVGVFLGARAVGLYAAITNITSQVNTFSTLPVQPLLAMFGGKISSIRSQAEMEEELSRAFKINSLVALGLGSGLFTLAPFLLRFVGSDMPTSSILIPFRAAVLIYSIFSLNAVGYFILLAERHVSQCIRVVLSSGCFSVACIGFGCISMGVLGAIIGNACYITTIYLNIIALDKLDIPRKLFSNSIFIPACYFSFVIVSSLVAPFIGLDVLYLLFAHSLALVVISIMSFRGEIAPMFQYIRKDIL